MRTLLIGAAVAFLAAAAPGFASAQVTGHLEVGLELTDYSNNVGEFDAVDIAGGIGGAIDGIDLYGDGRAVLQSWDNSSETNGSGYAAVHISPNVTESFDIAGYVGIIDHYGDAGYMVGLEARGDAGNFSFQGALSYADFDQFFDYNAWQARVDAGYFFAPNLVVNVGLGYTEWDEDGAIDNLEATTYSIGGAYGFSNGVSIHASYTRDEWEGFGTDTESDAFQIRVRLNLNGSDLQTQTNDEVWSGAANFESTFLRS